MRSIERITVEDYQPFFDEFNPVNYNPREWAKAAKSARMKYAVLTAKHHDGFCLFDSKLTDYKATNTPAGRDLVQDMFYISCTQVPFNAEKLQLLKTCRLSIT